MKRQIIAHDGTAHRMLSAACLEPRSRATLARTANERNGDDLLDRSRSSHAVDRLTALGLLRMTQPGQMRPGAGALYVLTREGELMLDALAAPVEPQEYVVPGRTAFECARSYLLNLLALRGLHPAGMQDACERGMLTELEFDDVVEMFYEWVAA